MDEATAKTKWCPFARTVEHDHQTGGNTAPRNRVQTAKGSTPSVLYAERLAGTRCIASACMAWRWANDYERRWDLPADKPPEGAGWQRVEAIGGVAHWVRQHATPHGYCGLAGAPQ